MTDRHYRASTLDDALHQLRIDLNGHHQVVDLSEWGEQRVRSAIEWLLAVRNDQGYWGYRSPAVTATCTMAIGLWRPTEAEALLAPSTDWLLDQADSEGSWETLWDSAIAVAAVHSAGRADDPRARLAMRHLAEFDPATCPRPHHGAQVLTAAKAGDWAPARRERWMSEVGRQLDLQAGPYVVGQAVYGLLSAGRPVGDLTEPLGYLADYLSCTPISTAEFLGHTAALRALARAGRHADVVDSTIDDLFGSAFRRDGSWYHEPWYTGWALLALHEANAVRRVVVEQPRMDEYLGRLTDAVSGQHAAQRRRQEQERQERIEVMAATVFLTVGVVRAAALAFMLPDSNRLVTSGLGMTLLAAVVAAAWRWLRPLLDPHRPPPNHETDGSAG